MIPRSLVAKGSYKMSVSQVSMPEGPRHQGKLWSECFPSVDAPRGLVAKGNYEVSVSQVSMPTRGLVAKGTLKCVFPKCRCPEGPRRQGKPWSECFLSVDAPRGLVAKRNCAVNVYEVIVVWKGPCCSGKKNLAWRKSFSLQQKQWNWCMCFPSVDALRGLIAKGNFEVSVSQVSIPWGASSPRDG